MHCQCSVLMVVQAALLRGGQEADGTQVQQPSALSMPSPQPSALSPQLSACSPRVLLCLTGAASTQVFALNDMKMITGIS